MLRIDRWMLRMGLPTGLAQACMRLHLCPRLELSCGGAARVLHRVIGGLIGSRTAVMLGRVPVEDAFA
eukprot:11916225-Alexandrium_andersonii.AAC.1